MDRYHYQIEKTEGGLYPFFIYDGRRGHAKGREIARANDARVAQKIVDAMNIVDQRRRSAAA
jgi:hypothetical protein